MARPSKKEEKRIVLLAVAEKCFAKYGYAKTTLDDVAIAANITKATLYHYFTNKEALFLALVLSVANEGINGIIQKTSTLKKLEKQLYYFFLQRIALYVKLIKLNALSKESLVHLQANFEQVYAPIKQQEINFIKNLVETNFEKKSSVKFTTLLFQIVDALKHDAIFVGDLLEDNSKSQMVLQKQILQLLQIHLHHFKT